ncbi:metallophosphoesterase [Anianabacter salinae]|uniref:metallophosphoesterase n=1 Tax=Anianabacter salinae TaxID=2851023 RepID=UPI00225E3206|nr:metallophosphoesterase [Anianabacter salinae]
MMHSMRRFLREGTLANALDANPVFDAPVQCNEPIYAIGDLHGRSDMIAPMVNMIDADRSKRGYPDARIVFLGDYIDRGDKIAVTLGVLRALSDRSDGEIVCLLGNHEKMLLDFLDRPEEAGPRWLRHGGLQTLASFRVGEVCTLSTGKDLVRAADKLRGAMPVGLEGWLRDLPLTWQSGNVLCVHAAADPSLPVHIQSERTLLWGHKEFYSADRRDGIWIVHGHNVVSAPIARRGRVSVDTGAYFSGRLSAAALYPDEPVEFIRLAV